MNQIPSDYRVASIRLSSSAVPLIEFLALKYDAVIIGGQADEGIFIADVAVPAGATRDFVKDTKGFSGIKSVKVRLADNLVKKMMDGYTTFFVDFGDDEAISLINGLARENMARYFSYSAQKVGLWSIIYKAEISVPNLYATRFAESCRTINGVNVSTHTLDEMVIAVMQGTHRWALPGLESK